MGQTVNTSFTIQTSQAGTAGVRVTAGTTPVAITVSGNAEGAHSINIELNVTVAPSTTTFSELYREESQDGGSTWSAPRRTGEFRNITTSAGRYSTTVALVAAHTRFTWLPVGFGMTATMTARALTA